MTREFSELDLQLVMFDLNDTEDERDDNVVAGVAIRSEDMEAFAADVERLAVEKYGGATFSGLLEEDLGDESTAAAQQRRDAKRSEDLLAEAERAMASGIPEEPKRRPKPSIKGKTLEQVQEGYDRVKRRWDELQGGPRRLQRRGVTRSPHRFRRRGHLRGHGDAAPLRIARPAGAIRDAQASGGRREHLRELLVRRAVRRTALLRGVNHSQCPPDSTLSQCPWAAWWTVSYPVTVLRTSEWWPLPSPASICCFP